MSSTPSQNESESLLSTLRMCLVNMWVDIVDVHKQSVVHSFYQTCLFHGLLYETNGVS